MNTLFTMGYGLTTKEAFQERLRDLQKETGKKVLIVDIRKEGSKSRNGRWCYQESLGITICQTGCKFGILKLPNLANIFGGTKESLRRYGLAIKVSIAVDPRDPFIYSSFYRLLNKLRDKSQVVVLLCSEREPFKPNGKTANCHRIPLGEKLVRELGEDWEVRHL